jgi:hypothetical protein
MGCGGSKAAACSSAVKQPILSASITVENPSPAKSAGKIVVDAPQEALTSLIRVESVSADDAATQDGKDLDAAAVKIQAIARGKSERQKQKDRKSALHTVTADAATQDGKDLDAAAVYAGESVSADDAATQDGKDLDAAAVKIQAIARGKSERQKQKDRKSALHTVTADAATQDGKDLDAAAVYEKESMSADDAAAQDGKDLDAAAVKIQAIARGKSERQKQKDLKALQH